MKNDSFVVTVEWIDEYATPNGAWTQSQLDQIGVTWPPPRGWKRGAVGRVITVQQKAIFEQRIYKEDA
ncbi:hypothetical protein PQR34_43865 [Paraburkholderia sediminicola]|uniref:hypothetical protein n=1 Tax=Paraburkholderia sediminicola TaxID=458836 RepID=UPI0038BA453C